MKLYLVFLFICLNSIFSIALSDVKVAVPKSDLSELRSMKGYVCQADWACDNEYGALGEVSTGTKIVVERDECIRNLVDQLNDANVCARTLDTEDLIRLKVKELNFVSNESEDGALIVLHEGFFLRTDYYNRYTTSCNEANLYKGACFAKFPEDFENITDATPKTAECKTYKHFPKFATNLKEFGISDARSTSNLLNIVAKSPFMTTFIGPKNPLGSLYNFVVQNEHKLKRWNYNFKIDQ
jgi:hypothetical protein